MSWIYPPRTHPETTEPASSLVCYVYRGPFEFPSGRIVVSGTMALAKAQAQRLLTARPANRLVEIYRGEECLARLFQQPMDA